MANKSDLDDFQDQDRRFKAGEFLDAGRSYTLLPFDDGGECLDRRPMRLSSLLPQHSQQSHGGPQIPAFKCSCGHCRPSLSVSLLWRAFTAATPLGRVCTADDVADADASLVLGSAMVTGVTLTVDGGALVRASTLTVETGVSYTLSGASTVRVAGALTVRGRV
jgi:hypothetical protein